MLEKPCRSIQIFDLEIRWALSGGNNDDYGVGPPGNVRLMY